MIAIRDDKAGGTVVAFQGKGPSTQYLESKDCINYLGSFMINLAIAARIIVKSTLSEEEKRKTVREIGLLASRIAYLQANAVEKRISEFIHAGSLPPFER